MSEKISLQVVESKKVEITKAELHRILKNVLPVGAKIIMPEDQADIHVTFPGAVTSIDI